MTARAKILALHIAKWLGVFALAEVMTAKRLRILCFHGASWHDEHLFRPTLFMSPEVFAQRMRWLKARQYTVLPLPEALRLRRENRLPSCPVVITIDDGWSGTAEYMLPVLRANRFPATLYIATHAVEEAEPIAHVLVAYILWRSRKAELDLSAIDPRWQGRRRIATSADRAETADHIARQLRAIDGPQERMAYVMRLAAHLGVDGSSVSPAAFSLMSKAQLASAAEFGVDLQLHTHNHRMPLTDDHELRREIADNRASLRPLTFGDLRHFCYPSGQYDPRVVPTLTDAGILSATTCAPGFVDRATPDLALPRFLDADDIPLIVFEAEMTGVLELARGLRRAIHRATQRHGE